MSGYDSDHPLLQRYTELSRLDLGMTQAERVVVQALLWFGDWRTGADCYPDLASIATYTHLSRRTIQRALDRLACPTPVQMESGAYHPCLACGNVDLLLLTQPARPNSSASYDVCLGEFGVQHRLPEVAARGGILTDRGDILTDRLATG